MASPGHRKGRLAGTIRKHLGGELSREVKDPRLASLYIESVDLTGDLGLAKVGVRLIFGGDDPVVRRDAMAALARLTPGLRASLGPVLRMRRIPELRFYYDEGADHRAKIEAVLEEISREDAERVRSPGPSANETADAPSSGGPGRAEE